MTHMQRLDVLVHNRVVELHVVMMVCSQRQFNFLGAMQMEIPMSGYTLQFIGDIEHWSD